MAIKFRSVRDISWVVGMVKGRGGYHQMSDRFYQVTSSARIDISLTESRHDLFA
jgi:hypothetical protein